MNKTTNILNDVWGSPLFPAASPEAALLPLPVLVFPLPVLAFPPPVLAFPLPVLAFPLPVEAFPFPPALLDPALVAPVYSMTM